MINQGIEALKRTYRFTNYNSIIFNCIQWNDTKLTATNKIQTYETSCVMLLVWNMIKNDNVTFRNLDVRLKWENGVLFSPNLTYLIFLRPENIRWWNARLTYLSRSRETSIKIFIKLACKLTFKLIYHLYFPGNPNHFQSSQFWTYMFRISPLLPQN